MIPSASWGEVFFTLGNLFRDILFTCFDCHIQIYVYVCMYDNARNGILQNLWRCKLCFSLLRNIHLLLQILMLYFVDIFGNIIGWGSARMNHLEQKCQSKLLKTFRYFTCWKIDLGDFNHLKPTGYVMHHQFHSTTVRSAHTVFMCFVFIWEQTATCATYSINWLVFVTEMKSVYSAVRTGSLNKAVCALSLEG